ncbi:MAG: hypothetical protein JRN68_10145, partial [Nitrososphaerota archaeon]|nr:hypothetical protein [Nitrososphaerota archaeon]
LRPAKRAPRYRRTERIVAEIRGQIAQQLRIDASEVRLSEELNRFVWSHGGRSYLPRITVLMKKDEEGVTTVQLPSEIKKEEEAESKEAKEETEKEAEAPINQTEADEVESVESSEIQTTPNLESKVVNEETSEKKTEPPKGRKGKGSKKEEKSKEVHSETED